MKRSEQCLECNNCSRNVCIFISIYLWLSCQNCCMLHVIYPLDSSLHWQLLCNRWRNKGNVLASLINNLSGRTSSGRVQPERFLRSSAGFSAWPSTALASVEPGLHQSSEGALSKARMIHSLLFFIPSKTENTICHTIPPKLFSLSRSSVIRSPSLGKPRVSWYKVVTDNPQSITKC